MPKYLFEASYTSEGAKGLLKEGGSSRRATVEQAIKALGGTPEAFYFAYGDADVIVIADMPDYSKPLDTLAKSRRSPLPELDALAAIASSVG